MSSRKQKAWTVSDNVNAVERFDKGESQAKVSRDLGVSVSTLLGWLKDKEKLHKFLHMVDQSDGLNRRRAREISIFLCRSLQYNVVLVISRMGSYTAL